jgi:sulfite exporter TauE/SafE
LSDLSQFSEIISQWSYLSVPAGVFIASIVGSTHCAAMCGPIAINVHNKIGYLSLYHVGRLLSYLALGTLAGLIGERFLSDNYPFISTMSLILLSLFLIYTGVNLLRGKQPELIPGRFVTSVLAVPARWSLGQTRPLAAFTLGIVNGFIPCGWLYIFVIGALAAKTPLFGGVILFVFWLGTVPALSLLPLMYKKSMKFAPRKLSVAAGMILILVGLANFAIHMRHSDKISQGNAVCSVSQSNSVRTSK